MNQDERKTAARRMMLLIAVAGVIIGLYGFRLIFLQLVNGDSFKAQATNTTDYKFTVTAARGNIVDSKGERIASSVTGYNVVLNKLLMGDEDLDALLQKLVGLLGENGESWNDSLLIGQADAAGHYAYTAESDNAAEQRSLAAMKENLGLQQYATADDVMEKLVEDYDLADFSFYWQRILGGIHYEMQLQAFSNVNNFILAENVSEATVATIKENSLTLPGVEIVETSARSYEQGTVLPHVLGRVGKITAEKWKVTDENGQVTYPLKEKGYNMNDVIGISGLESAYEDELRGKDGVETITRNSDGVIVNTALTTVPEPGHTVQLTIDSEFQKAVDQALAKNVEWIRNSYGDSKQASAGAVVVIDVKTGGVLAAMTTGDRSYLSSAMRSAYRGAGLSHVLVVSGMHVSILCGDILSVLLPYRWEQRYRSRRRRTVWKSLLALVLMGVTGFTPSVRRAAVAVWVSALGVWVWGPSDALTSLAAAGILMTAANSYAVWDIGFELSFAAVVGTVAGNACIRRMRDAHDRHFWIKAGENLQKPVRRPWFNRLPERLQGLAESACIAACASAATFPVLVLRGLSVSAWAVVSSIAVLWMVQPLLLLGLAVAFVGLVPWLAPVHGVLSRAADLLTGLLNGWAVWLCTKPGASIYFDTAYAALVCLLLCGLGVLAFRWRVRLRVAVPGILLAAAVGIGLDNALSRDVVHIDLVGSAQAPAVVVAQNDRAVVLFRGGSAAQRAVENQLARRGVRTVELVVDLRMNAKTACTLPAQQGIRAERLPVNASRKLRCTPAAVELLRTREGCLVRLSIGNRQFVILSGKIELAQPLQTEWLVAMPKKPETVQYQKLLALRSYSWMPPETQYTASLSLRRTGGERLE